MMSPNELGRLAVYVSGCLICGIGVIADSYGGLSISMMGAALIIRSAIGD